MSTCGSEAEPTLLDFDVIVSAIHDISDGTLAVTTENLKNIQSETAIEIYRALLFAQFPGASEQLSLLRVSEHVLEIKHHWLQEDSISLLGLTVTLSSVFKACCINNFSFRDLVAPKPKRTHRLLSSLVNYLRFCNSKQNVVDDAFSQCNEIKQCAEEEEQVTDDKNRGIEELELKRAEERRELAKLKPEAEMRRSDYNEMLHQQSGDEKRSAQEVQSVQNKAALLNSVQMEDKIKEGTEISLERSSRLNRLIFKERQLRDLEEDCATALKLISCFAAALEKHTGMTRSLDLIKEKVRIREQSFTDLSAGIQNVIRQQNMKTERDARIQSQHQKSTTEKLKEIEIEQGRMATMKTDLDMKIRQEIAEIEDEISEVSVMISVEDFKFQERMKKAADVYGRILDRLDVYHQSLSVGFGKLTKNVTF